MTDKSRIILLFINLVLFKTQAINLKALKSRLSFLMMRKRTIKKLADGFYTGEKYSPSIYVEIFIDFQRAALPRWLTIYSNDITMHVFICCGSE